MCPVCALHCTCSWLEESMFWLATRAEANLESHKLAQAMEASLQEQQAARQQEAKQPPLTNLSEERLRKRFASSAVLQCLGTLLPGSVLFCGTSPLREQIKYKLVEVLRLEADCLKWYPDSGARHYFEHFGKTCLEELSSTSSSTTQIIVQAASSMQEAQQQLQQPVQQKPQQRSHQQQQPHALQDVQQQQCHWQCHQQQSPTPPQQQHQQQHKARPAARPPSEESSDAGEGVLKRSTRKRQPPSRYCSPSPCIGGRGRSKQRKVTPEPAGVRSAATASTAKAALSAATAVASMHNGSAAQQNSPAASPINAGSSKGAAVAFKQQQQQQTNEPASNHRLIQRLSELLEQEHKAITEAVFVTLPSAAGAVPDIFKTLQAEAENEGGDESDVELLKVENTAAAATSDRAADAQAEESEPPAAAAIAGAVSGCTAEQSYDAGRAPADIGDDDLSDCIIVNSD
eukprot:GHRR01023592.1.p1 GENE.GHRR01023592.1~~GHRR01023592.1.p1  ORF type:complete len:459 (+),score=225.18 GHRR01023592.1:220-1596(+)